MFQRVGTVLPAPQGRDTIDSEVILLFLVRKLPKAGGHNRDDMSHLFKLIRNVRAGIPRTATNGWIFAVNDKDMHTEI